MKKAKNFIMKFPRFRFKSDLLVSFKLHRLKLVNMENYPSKITANYMKYKRNMSEFQAEIPMIIKSGRDQPEGVENS